MLEITLNTRYRVICFEEGSCFQKAPSPESRIPGGPLRGEQHSLSTRGGSPLELQIHGSTRHAPWALDLDSRFNVRHFARNSSQTPPAENAPSRSPRCTNVVLRGCQLVEIIITNPLFFNYTPYRSPPLLWTHFFPGYHLGKKFEGWIRDKMLYCAISEIIEQVKQVVKNRDGQTNSRTR